MESSSKRWGGEDAWQENLDKVRNLVRQELVSRQLDEFLPPPDYNISVLDIGCGQGTQVLRLAKKGYSVTGIDISTQMLRQAEQEVDKENSIVRSRIRLLEGNIHQLSEVVDRTFEVVLCHGVIMYMPSLRQTLEEIVDAASSGALVSVLARNQASIAMRAGMMGDWQKALEGFDASNYDNRVGMKDTRADKVEEVIEVLGELGVSTSAWFGVRLFTDHWGNVDPPSDFDQILAAEEEAGKRDPYRQLASLSHVIGIKS